ncbi:hypothetical protein O3P69_009600 [Scylla paramamosain]|uniref:Uncharacterized protein n=1 Tax=Scylla paramamosain TaxID=85552 RepID=A0AAW0SVH4_SCYPA
MIQEALETDDWVLVDFHQNVSVKLECDLESDAISFLSHEPPKCDSECGSLENDLVFLESHFEGHLESSLDPELTLESLVLEDEPGILDSSDGGEVKQDKEEKEEVLKDGPGLLGFLDVEEVKEDKEGEEEEEDEEETLFFSDFHVGGSHRRKQVTLGERTQDRIRKPKRRVVTAASDNFKNPHTLNTEDHHPFCRRPRIIEPPDKHPRKNRRRRRNGNIIPCWYCESALAQVDVSKAVGGRTVYRLDKRLGYS